MIEIDVDGLEDDMALSSFTAGLKEINDNWVRMSIKNETDAQILDRQAVTMCVAKVVMHTFMYEFPEYEYCLSFIDDDNFETIDGRLYKKDTGKFIYLSTQFLLNSKNLAVDLLKDALELGQCF